MAKSDVSTDLRSENDVVDLIYYPVAFVNVAISGFWSQMGQTLPMELLPEWRRYDLEDDNFRIWGVIVAISGF
ncbi:unnamed protein product [Litomosoides sigmodontis]|uniref:Uncharacterized protein n=1 Tax=Litomosoides sigmodontis TaxID=42156 RepID=A0A3P6U097_LITSI|nr:unnamed protein product [Litomosoides sigmodontis]